MLRELLLSIALRVGAFAGNRMREQRPRRAAAWHKYARCSLWFLIIELIPDKETVLREV